MSRKRSVLLLAAFAALAAILSACGGGGGGSSEDPQKVIESATFEGIESGEVALSVNVESEGDKAGNVKVDLSGPFQTTGKASLPELALAIKADGDAEGENVNFDGGLTVLGDRAFIAYDGTNYEVDPTTFGFIKSGFEEAAQEGGSEGGGGETTACQQAAESLDLGDFIDNLENEGSEDVDGVGTTKLSGDLNPKKAIEAVIKLAESSACSSELDATGALPLDELKEQESELTETIKKAHITVNIGEDDQIPRKVAAEMTIEPKDSNEVAEVELEFTLSGVNEEQTIKAPAGAEPIEKLFEKIGINPLELLGMLEGGGSGGLDSLLEGIGGESEGSSSGDLGGQIEEGLEEAELPSAEDSKEFTECLDNAESAADVQKCATLME
ncbi:MAG TPA: hypothetical protein VN522_01155 [Solirubrobacterales bacterium]|nr:hypothetical protein [Solirubrobacterales bacterium]